MLKRPSRRQFLKRSAASTLAFPAICSSFAQGAPNDKLNIAAVGVGGKGRGDIASTSQGQNVVAICDVDDRTLRSAAELYPRARVYHDWRKMLEQNDIDAVTVSTPDHMHAPVAVSAMQRGKHVYVQKPMAHTLFEARQMQILARENRVVSQMGNQGHSGTGYLTLVKLIQSGAIGKVQQAHAWSNRPIWPQGIERPQRSDSVPEHLHWDLWLGVAAERPFVGPTENSKKGRGAYHPFNWRGWLDFGVGALGDMGCHIIDPVVWSLQLGVATHVWSDGPAPNQETYPLWGIIHYQFQPTEFTTDKPIVMTWYDGGKKPSRELARLPEGQDVPDNGCLLIGEKGVLLCKHGGIPVLLPQAKFADYEIEQAEGNDHYMQWTNACKGVGKTTSHFDYASPLTETVLLGTVAIRFPQQKLEWDSTQLRFTNNQDANEFVHHSYRSGWEVNRLTAAPVTTGQN